MDWVGYWLDYTRFELGISESRTKWLVEWAERILRDGHVLLRNLAEGVGRLGFSMGVLEWGSRYTLWLRSCQEGHCISTSSGSTHSGMDCHGDERRTPDVFVQEAGRGAGRTVPDGRQGGGDQGCYWGMGDCGPPS